MKSVKLHLAGVSICPTTFFASCSGGGHSRCARCSWYLRDNLPIFSRSRKIVAGEAAPAPVSPFSRMEEAQIEADELARQGRYSEAMHLLLLKSLNEIRRNLGINFAVSLTSREILRRIQLSDIGRRALGAIIQSVERSILGERGQPSRLLRMPATFRRAAALIGSDDTSVSGQSPFNPRIVAALGAALVVLLAASLLLSGNGRTRQSGDSVGPHTYSRSAVGHLGVFDILQQLGYRTVRGERDVLAQLGANGALVLAEPANLSGVDNTSKLFGATRLLVVLPKRNVRRSDSRDGWIADAQLAPTFGAQAVFYSVAGTGNVFRVDAPSGFKRAWLCRILWSAVRSSWSRTPS